MRVAPQARPAAASWSPRPSMREGGFKQKNLNKDYKHEYRLICFNINIANE